LGGLSQISKFNAQRFMVSALKKKLTKSVSTTLEARMLNRTFTCLCLYITCIVSISAYFGLVSFISSLKNFMFAAIFLIDINENSFAMSYNTTKVNIKLVSYKRIRSLLSMKLERPRK
jgi:hypothetical protein